MRRGRIWGVGLALVVLACPGEARAQDCAQASKFTELGSGGAVFQTEAFFTSRADLSNPGARALALGGAFISSADDTTSVLANPAGLTALVRPTVQVEGRLSPVVRYDVYGSGLLTPGADNGTSTDRKGAGTGFASVALPFADIFVAAVFYQRVLTVSDFPNREESLASGPCLTTKNPFSGAPIRVLLPYGRLEGSSSIDRVGASLSVRLGTFVSAGVTGFYVREKRDQTFLQLEAGVVDNVTPNRVNGSSGKAGGILGVQLTPSEVIRIGATYSLPVELEVPGSFKQTVLPARAGLGITVSPPSTRLSIALEGVFSETSRLKDATDFDRLFSTGSARLFEPARNPASWDVANSIEVRLGIEYAVVQTRTRLVSLRLGGFTERFSLFQFNGGGAGVDVSTQYGLDAVRTLFSGQDDPRLYHVSGGIGILSRKKLQADLGVDYEVKTKRVAVSGLLGYTF